MRAKDMTNLKFGRLLVLKRDSSKKARNAYWICECDCGEVISVSRPNLINQHVSSCGCLRKEETSKRLLIDLTGLKFGKLFVLERDFNRTPKGVAYWKCRCECGGTASIRSAHLRKGNTVSCGCVKSRGERDIAEILIENKINFIKQYPVKINNQNYYFDFAIIDNINQVKYFIEFDGEQHFHFRENGWNSKENLKNTQRRDLIKNIYCQESGIPLIRIRYDEEITLKVLGKSDYAF